MTTIYVLSIAGNILDIIQRKRFEKDMIVPYKGKRYKVYDRRKTNLGGYAIYPYGVTRKWNPKKATYDRKMKKDLIDVLKEIKRWNANVEEEMKEWMDAYYIGRMDIVKILWLMIKRK